MKRFAVRLLVLSTLTALCGCAKPYNAYRMDRTEFMGKIKTIGVMPVAVEPRAAEYFQQIEITQLTATEFEKLIEGKLVEAGFKVVPASEYRSIMEHITETVGISDLQSLTAAQRRQYEFVYEHTKNEYLSKHKVDAYAVGEISVERAYWSGTVAHWDGIKDNSTGKNGIWEAMLTSNAYGSLPAMSMRLSIRGLDNTLYYRYYGGIQLLKWLNTGINFKGTFVDVPKENLFSFPDRNKKSVEIACAPLIYEELPNEYKLFKESGGDPNTI